VYKLLRGQFRPAGATRCTDGVKFVMEEWTKFHPHRCNDKGIGPQKLKILLKFDQTSEYKRPAVPYSLRDFHEICRICTSLQDTLAVKIWMDLLKGLRSYGGFKRRGSGFPKFTMPSWWSLDFTPRQGGQKRLSFSVCLFVHHTVEHIPNFRPMSFMAQQLDGSGCQLVRR